MVRVGPKSLEFFTHLCFHVLVQINRFLCILQKHPAEVLVFLYVWIITKASAEYTDVLVPQLFSFCLKKTRVISAFDPVLTILEEITAFCYRDLNMLLGLKELH